MAKLYEPKTDCFGYPEDESGPACSVLNDMLCVTRGVCPFYATRAEVEEKSKSCRARAIQMGYYLGSGKYAPKEDGES